MTEDEDGDFRAELAPGFGLLQVVAFFRNGCAFVAGFIARVFAAEREEGHL
jgi:hypothetical protein